MNTKPTNRLVTVNSLVIARLRELAETTDEAELIDAYASVIDHIEALEPTFEADPPTEPIEE